MRQTEKGKITISFVECTPLLLSWRTGRQQAPPANHSRADLSCGKRDVAGLRAKAIDRMTRDELIGAIRASALPMLQCPEASDHLGAKDLETLRRLVYLGRLSCRNQGF